MEQSDFEMVMSMCYRYNQSLQNYYYFVSIKILLYEHKNIFVQRTCNIGVVVINSCLKIGGELSETNCPGVELSGNRWHYMYV